MRCNEGGAAMTAKALQGRANDMVAYYKVIWTMPASIDGKPLQNAWSYQVNTHSAIAADFLLDLIQKSPYCCGAYVEGVLETDLPF